MKKTIIAVLAVLISASWIGAGQTPAAPPKIVILDVAPFTYVCVPHKGPFTDMQQVIGTLMQAMGNQRLFPPTGPMMGVYYTAPSGSAPEMVWGNRVPGDAAGDRAKTAGEESVELFDRRFGPACRTL